MSDPVAPVAADEATVRSRVSGLLARLRFTPSTRDGAPMFWFLTLLVAGLTGIGLVFVLSASSVMSMEHGHSAWYFFERQFVFALLGTVAYLIGARLDYRLWERWAPRLLVVTVVSLFLVLIPGIGRYVNGARRWIGLNSLIGFQPSEIAKLVLLLFAARLLSHRVEQLDDWRRATMPLLVITVAMCFLVVLEPDLDAAMEIALVAMGVLFAAGIPRKHLAAIVGGAAAAVSVLAIAAPYRLSRLLTFMHPGRDLSNKSYQINQALIALGNGGWTGVGLGNGHAKWLFLPAAHTDFIFAIIGEETGMLGGLFVLALFGAFAAIGCRIAMRAPDRFAMLLAAGVTTWVCGQMLLNVAMVIGMAPVSGTPLPFISAGGSSLVVLMFAVGILANVARHCALPTPTRSSAHPALRRTHGVRVFPSA